MGRRDFIASLGGAVVGWASFWARTTIRTEHQLVMPGAPPDSAAALRRVNGRRKRAPK